MPITIGSATPGFLTQGVADFYEILPGADGRLIAQTTGASAAFELRLSLFDAQGNLKVASDGQSIGRLDPLIDQHVSAGADILEVQSLQGAGNYSLSTSFTIASNPGQTLTPAVSDPYAPTVPLAVGDFNADGIPDLVSSGGVYLGTGDGTFQAMPPISLPDGSEPTAIVADDFGRGQVDLAVLDPSFDALYILQGNGDGTFQPATPANTIGLPGGGYPDAIVAGDFGTGHVDLAVADSALNMVFILDGDGQGNFQLASSIPVGLGPVAITEGNFTGTGPTDLAVADNGSGDVTVLANDGAGNFHALSPIQLPPGAGPTALVAGDFGTGHLDLAVADAANGAVDLLIGHGDDTFDLGSSTAVGPNPVAIVAGNFTDSGHLSLATADENGNDVSVLVGNGDGTFQPTINSAAGNTPLALVAGYFNSDGRLDLATGNLGSDDVSVLLGKGDGTFEEPATNPAGTTPAAVATGDFTGNGKIGVAIVDQGSDSVTVLPGTGDGTFGQPLTTPLPAGSVATSVVAADFNGDGRLDLAITDSGLNEVYILLGNGDGTFESLAPIPVPSPTSIVSFTEGGFLDLAVASGNPSAVTILLGNGKGTFTPETPIPLGQPNNPPTPEAIVAGIFTSSGYTDLAVADVSTNDVTVLLFDPAAGTFIPQTPISLGGGSPSQLAMVAGDFRNNGVTDLAVAATDFFNGDTVDVLLGNGDGTFTPETPIQLGFFVEPVAIVAGHFTHSGLLDLATADGNGTETDDYSVYLNMGGGTFSGPFPAALGGAGGSTAIATGDFAGDGRTDLAIARIDPDDVQVRLSGGDGTFSAPSPSVLNLDRETPLVADANGDGAA